MTDKVKDGRVESVMPPDEAAYREKSTRERTSALPLQERDPEKSVMPPDEADYHTSAMPPQRFAMDIDQ